MENIVGLILSSLLYFYILYHATLFPQTNNKPLKDDYVGVTIQPKIKRAFSKKLD